MKQRALKKKFVLAQGQNCAIYIASYGLPLDFQLLVYSMYNRRPNRRGVATR